MTSDDTEHTCLVAEALLISAGDVGLFRAQLASELRRWLLSIPVGIGLATLKATIRLCLGVSPEKSGVFSAGNGPAMRSALIGVCFCHESDRMKALVRASTRLTHTDPKAEWAAYSVALAASYSCQAINHAERYLSALREACGSEASEYIALVEAVAHSASRRETTEQFAESMGWGRGVSGYCYQSVTVALHAWMSNPNDYRGAVLSAIRCGGDTDTTGAIAGAIAGARTGRAGIPADWVSKLTDWPRSVSWMEVLSGALAHAIEMGQGGERHSIPYAGLLLRNALFGAIVIGHGFRRLLPPY